MNLMEFLPWKKKAQEGAVPELDSSGLDVDSAVFASGEPGPLANEEEALLDQYFDNGGDTQAKGPKPAVRDVLDSALDETGVAEQSASQDVLADLAATQADDADDDAVDDDLMAIFEEEEAVDEDLTALTQGLQDVDAGSLLTQARRLSGWLGGNG